MIWVEPPYRNYESVIDLYFFEIKLKLNCMGGWSVVLLKYSQKGLLCVDSENMLICTSCRVHILIPVPSIWNIFLKKLQAADIETIQGTQISILISKFNVMRIMKCLPMGWEYGFDIQQLRIEPQDGEFETTLHHQSNSLELILLLIENCTLRC